MSEPRVLPLGDAAWSVELGDSLDLATNARVRALDRELAERPIAGFVEAVPTLRSLLVVYDPRAARPAAVASALAARLSATSAPLPAGRIHEVPTLYGGDAGPDLEPLARERGLAPRELVRLHASREYTALMLGFKPGFAYLGIVPPELECARLETPRVRVPAGSVGIAARQTGIYPVASPGGWRLIGRTSLRLFDPDRQPPALFAAGDRVRFVPTDELPDPPPLGARPPHVECPVAEVLEPGLLTTVQDAGRPGFRRLGVCAAGALDSPAHAARTARSATRRVPRPSSAAWRDRSWSSWRPRASPSRAPTWAPCSSAPTSARGRCRSGPPSSRAPATCCASRAAARAAARTSRFRAGSTCRRCWARAPPTCSRASAASRAARCGRATGSGWDARQAAGRPAARRTPPLTRDPSVCAPCRARRTTTSRRTIARFLAGVFRLGATADRVGCRLEGEPLRHAGPSEILSDGMVPGSIQVPPDGQPIVMLADGPTTGGYPKIATVLSADLPLLAQLVPGEGEVRFEAVRLEDL